jgi:hypothetical protein
MHRLIERIPGTFRYGSIDTGITRALFLTRLHGNFLRTGLAAPASPAGKNRDLAAASRACAPAINDLARQAGFAGTAAALCGLAARHLRTASIPPPPWDASQRFHP